MGFWSKVKAFFTGKSETQVVREKAAKQASKAVRKEHPGLPKHRTQATPPPPTAPVKDQYDYVDQTVVDNALSWNDKVNDLEAIWSDRDTPHAVGRAAFEEWWSMVAETFTPIEDFDWDGFREYYAEIMPA